VKKSPFLFITGLTLLWSASCIAAPGELGDNGGINTNPHNLSSRSLNVLKAVVQATPGKETQICIFCHTPHSARSVAPLWGRPDSTETFGIRAGLQISNAAIVNTTLYGTAPDYPNGATKVCLSCHDGVTAMGILANGNEIDMTLSTLVGRNSQIDLTISHPVSFVYNSAVQTFLGGTYIWPTTAYLDSASRVQCTTCHEPHQDTRQGGTNYPFWRVGSGSATDYNTVCESCHTTPVPATLPSEHNF
jgi:hypothetical protein